MKRSKVPSKIVRKEFIPLSEPGIILPNSVRAAITSNKKAKELKSTPFYLGKDNDSSIGSTQQSTQQQLDFSSPLGNEIEYDGFLSKCHCSNVAICSFVEMNDYKKFKKQPMLPSILLSKYECVNGIDCEGMKLTGYSRAFKVSELCLDENGTMECSHCYRMEVEEYELDVQLNEDDVEYLHRFDDKDPPIPNIDPPISQLMEQEQLNSQAMEHLNITEPELETEEEQLIPSSIADTPYPKDTPDCHELEIILTVRPYLYVI